MLTVILIWQLHKDLQINLCHYRSIYTTSMGFSPYSTEIRQFKISPTAYVMSKLPNIMFAYILLIGGVNWVCILLGYFGKLRFCISCFAF